MSDPLLAVVESLTDLDEAKAVVIAVLGQRSSWRARALAAEDRVATLESRERAARLSASREAEETAEDEWCNGDCFMNGPGGCAECRHLAPEVKERLQELVKEGAVEHRPKTAPNGPLPTVKLTQARSQPPQEESTAEGEEVKPRLVYLASPYSSDDLSVRDARFDAVCREAAFWMSEGIHIYSPIAHTHPIAIRGELPTDWTFWEAYDRVMIDAADEVWVLKLDGWDTSRGVSAEMQIADALGKPVRLIEARSESPRTPESPAPLCSKCGGLGVIYGDGLPQVCECERDVPESPASETTACPCGRYEFLVMHDGGVPRVVSRAAEDLTCWHEEDGAACGSMFPFAPRHTDPEHPGYHPFQARQESPASEPEEWVRTGEYEHEVFGTMARWKGPPGQSAIFPAAIEQTISRAAEERAAEKQRMLDRAFDAYERALARAESAEARLRELSGQPEAQQETR